VAKKVGVLALQGDFAEHVTALECAGAEPAQVRLPRDLAGVEALVIPGGESTTISRLMDVFELAGEIKARVRDGMPTWGTCAGLIVLAASLTDDRPKPLGLIDVRVQRNGYGRQVDSFEADLHVAELGDEAFRAVFIRAPVIEQVGPGVKQLACLGDGRVVAVRQRNILATSFHPELTGDCRFHSYFLSMASEV
jgi:5'-phosphate synthase pdxT subunit